MDVHSLREQVKQGGQAKWSSAVQQESLQAEINTLRNMPSEQQLSDSWDHKQVENLNAKVAKMDKYRAKLEASLSEAVYELKHKKSECDRLQRTVNALLDRSDSAEIERQTSLAAYRPGILSKLDAEYAAQESELQQGIRKSQAAVERKPTSPDKSNKPSSHSAGSLTHYRSA